MTMPEGPAATQWLLDRLTGLERDNLVAVIWNAAEQQPSFNTMYERLRKAYRDRRSKS